MPTNACETPGGKWSKRYPDLGTGPVSIEPYISAEYFEKEREYIFRKVWLNVGRVEQIPEPGDYFVKDLANADDTEQHHSMESKHIFSSDEEKTSSKSKCTNLDMIIWRFL